MDLSFGFYGAALYVIYLTLVLAFFAGAKMLRNESDDDDED